jgi:RHS repeat-associated protein
MLNGFAYRFDGLEWKPSGSLNYYVNANVKAYYTSASGFTQAPLATIVNAVAAVLVGGNPAITNEISQAYSGSNQGNGSLLLAPYQGSSKPSAFLNYILFDEEYKVIEAKSAPVGPANVLHQVALPTIEVKELGYLFVYLSYDNESAHWVHFDELKITHTESPVLQVNAYYPFGMMAYTWLRDGEKENLYGYQGKEYDSLTRWHDFHARQYDGALGRWFAVDPQDQFASPYLAMGNNPVMMVDPDGELAFIPFLLTAIKIYGAVSTAYNVYQAYRQNGLIGAGQALMSAATGMAIGAALGPLSVGPLVDFANIKGAFPGGVVGGLSGALTGGLAGGINSSLWGGDFSDGFRGGAIGGAVTGALAGGNWGYINAKNAGKNVWWGNDVKYNRTQTSFFNFNKPDIYRSPIRANGGSKITNGCFPKCLETTGLLYGKDEYYFASEYSSFTGEPFDGVSTSNVEQFIESLPGPLFVDRPKLGEIGSHMEAGKRIVGGMNRYLSNNAPEGSRPSGHAMNLKKLKTWPDGRFKMTFINPDGGGKFRVTKPTYSQFGPWRWYSIYR